MLTSAEPFGRDIESDVTWPQSGRVDSGWLELSTIDENDPATNKQASVDWNLEFAPGAEVSNVSLQVRVNGSDGLIIDSPLLVAQDTGERLFDFSGQGPLGALASFDGFNPYSDRLAPNSATGAGWTLPANAAMTDLTLEALTPADPIALFDAVNISDFHSAQHPDDGQLYLSTGNTVYVLDGNNAPEIIDSFALGEAMGGIVGIEVGPNGNIHVATSSGQFKTISRANGTLQPGLASLETDGLAAFKVTNSGVFGAYNNGSLYAYNQLSSSWGLLVSPATTTSWFDITEVYDIHEQSDVLYLGTNNGVHRFDLNSNLPSQQPFLAQNVLHSDTITQIETVGAQLLFASPDKGIARLNHTTGAWLSTWDSGNVLPADEIYGMVSSPDVLHVLAGDSLAAYDRNSLAFSTPIGLDQVNLTESPSLTLLPWYSLGARSPSTDVHVATDGSGRLMLIKADAQSSLLDEILFATGPSDSDINDVLEYDGILYGAGFYSKVVERFDLEASVWLEPIPINDYVYTLARAGDTVLVGTYANGIYLVENGSVRGNIPAGNEYGQFAGTKSIRDIDSTGDCSTALGCELLFVQPYGVYTATADASSASGPTRILESFVLNYDVAIYGGVGFIATDEGLQRYDLANNTFLDTWGSTSTGRLNYAQVAVIGTTMHMGIEGFGVARKDILTGQSLSTLDSTTIGIGNDNVYSVEASGNNLWIGTDRGAWIWDGTTASKVLEGGFYERPQRFYDFELDGNTMYAGTNLGVCKYTLSGSFIPATTCNAYTTTTGQVTELAVNTTTLFAGTNAGVYLIDKATLAVVDTWTTDEETDSALVVVIDDVAYLGMSGIGVARWDIANEAWLTTWSEGVFGSGNTQITGMVSDVADRGLWVATRQSLTLVNTSTGQISQTVGINNAHDLTMYGNTMYYHLKDASDNIFSYDIINSTGNSPLDAGTVLGDETGFVATLGIQGDTLVASVFIVKSSTGNFGQIITADVGGIVQYDLVNQAWNASVNSSGPIDVVSYLNSSTGHSWVSWGNTGVEVYAPNGTSIGFWANISTVTEIVEYDGSILFATENGVQRFNETTFEWEPTWVSGNGLPSSTGNIIYELWTDGSILAVGISDQNPFVPKYFISFLELDGSWTSYQTGTTNVPRGAPFSMTQCGTYLYAGFWNTNGGLSAFDLTTLTAVRSWGGGSFPTGIENNKVSALACDDDEILYVGYNGKGSLNADLPISRYDTQNNRWLTTISQNANGITSDVISSDGLHHSDGTLFISTGIFGFTTTATTSFSYLQTNATVTGQVLVEPLRTAVTSYQYTGGELHLARAGGSTGVNSILKYNASGFDTLIQYASLASGNLASMEGEGGTLWVASQGGVLKGEYNATGGIEWMNGWSTPVGAVTTDMLLDGTDVYLTTKGSGLLKLDAVTGDLTLTTLSGAQHNNHGGLAMAVDASGAEGLIIGLLSSATTASGAQSFDLLSQQFTSSALLAGLPSNAIQGFSFSSDSLFIATSNGIGQRNLTANAWENPITVNDGLPDSFVGDVFWASNALYVGSLSGVTKYIPTTGTTTTLKQTDGLLGNSVASFGRYTTTNQDTWLVAVHDAAFGERPGLSVVNISSNSVVSTHRFDQLPSNIVTSVTADYGGVHIATDSGSLVHYNGLTDQFVAGITRSDVPSWPIRDMESDGVYLIVRGGSSISVVEARNTSHSLLKSFVVPNPQNVAVGPTGFWVASRDDGLFGWNTAFQAIPDGVARTANPLFASINGQVFNIGDMAHPGTLIDLLQPEFPLRLNSSIGSLDENGVLFQYVPLALSSPKSNAPVWVKTIALNYSAETFVSNSSALEGMLQLAINNGQIINQTRHVPLNLISAGEGSMEVRLTYDWVRKDTPVIFIDAYDRPNDGGGTLGFEWSLVADVDFKAYHVYVNNGPWDQLVSDINLENRIADASEFVYTRTAGTATTANGVPLVDGDEYYALVVVEYQNGRFGVPSSSGPLQTSDEVPTPPAWAAAVPYQGGESGELSVEWDRCMALDSAQTGIYILDSVDDNDGVLNASAVSTVAFANGNSTTVLVEPNVVHWLGFTCIDAGGQEDVENALIIGPVIAAGGENDALPPAPLGNVFAIDTPEDSGGVLTVGWDASDAEDCAFYQIFMVTGVEFSVEPTSVDGFTASRVITDCSVNSTLVSEFDGASLIDGQAYYIGVISYDVYLNAQITGVEIVNATPVDNLNGEIVPPDRVNAIEVFDTPNDNGTSIDVSWSVSNSNDFGYYTVWVADRPLDSVLFLWDENETNPDACGCVVFDQPWVGVEQGPPALRVTSGLYVSSNGAGETVNVSGLIRPNTQLYVAVTVHDSNGNAYLTGLLSPSVTPINNFLDDTAPERIDNITLQDRPLDDGSAVRLEFELSSASDIFEYHVFAAPFRFTSVGDGSDGPTLPVLIADRSPDFPLSITQLAGGLEVDPQWTVWVAVVPVDFAGNAIVTDLFTASIQSIDDGFASDGSTLPSVEGLVVSWVNGDEILIEWNQTASEIIEGYQIHISSENFSDITNATLVGDDVSTTRFVVTKEMFGSLSNTSGWYISVTPFDNENVKQAVETVELSANQAPVSSDGSDSDLSLQTLLSTPNLLVGGVVLAVLSLLVAFSRRRKGRSDISDAWDAQALTWGADEASSLDGLVAQGLPLPQGFNPESMPAPGGAMMPQMPLGQPSYSPPRPIQPGQMPPMQPVSTPPVQPIQSGQISPMQPVSTPPVQPIQAAQLQPAFIPPVQPIQPPKLQPADNPPSPQPRQVQPSANIDVSFLDELL